MDIDNLKRNIQDHFTDGLVAIIGSGLSVSEGIPGMGPLAEHLLSTLPSAVPTSSRTSWDAIAESLSKGTDLETALLAHPPNPQLEALITSATASFLLEFERHVFDDVLSNGRVLRFSRLLSVLRKEPTGIPVITTNYDRLIELAAECGGLSVDCSFVGHRFGAFDSKGSRMSLCRDVVRTKKGHRKAFCEHIRLFKPHGSLDWYQSSNGPVRCSLDLAGRRLMITPGGNKYLSGYQPPFDYHIGKANQVIDEASQFLIVGYGFNDAHLQTHITPRLQNGDPALIITRSLSKNASDLLPYCNGTIAITRSSSGSGTTVFSCGTQVEIPDIDLWDVDVFVKEIWKR